MDNNCWGLRHTAVFTCTIWAVAAWEKTTLGCSALQCSSSSPWDGKSSPQSSQGKVLSFCLKCSLLTWLCRAPGRWKDAEQYRQRKGCEPGRRSNILSLGWEDQDQPKGTGNCKCTARTETLQGLRHSICQHPFSCYTQLVAVQAHFSSSSLQHHVQKPGWCIGL